MRVMLTLLLAGLLLAGCPAPAPGRVSYEVRYEITSKPAFSTVKPTASSISYMTAGGDIAQETGVRLPWQRVLTARRGVQLSLVAQNKYDGTLTCRIYVDGVLLKEVTSRGAYAVVTCYGQVEPPHA